MNMGDKRPTSGRNAKISLVKLATTNNATKAFVPPVLQEVGKLAAGVAAVSAGSATGKKKQVYFGAKFQKNDILYFPSLVKM